MLINTVDCQNNGKSINRLCMSLSLYRKYRPVSIKDVVGQKVAKNIFKNAFRLDKIHHSYIFTGSAGVGKTSIARIISQTVNCQNIDEDCNPCMTCESCVEFQKGYGDVIEIDAAENRGIDDIRHLKEIIPYAPRFNKKVIIIDEVHMLTKEAFNALLKTLEEPPSYVVFILATTEFNKIPETIASRCHKINFSSISDADIIDRMQYICNQENIKFEKNALALIAKYSKGSLRDSISNLEQMAIVSNNFIKEDIVSESLGLLSQSFVNGLVKAILSKNELEVMQLINGVNQNIVAEVIFSDIIDIFRNNMTIKNATNITNIISTLIEYKNKLNYNTTAKTILEVACLNSIKVLKDKNKIDVIDAKLSSILELMKNQQTEK